MQPRQHRFSPTLKLDFHAGGSVIEVVEQWPDVEHIITNRFTDDADIMNKCNSMIGQINNVLCYSGKLPSQVNSRLLYAYCSSHYGCELWDLWNSNIANVCVAWRKALRRVWNLPLNTHSYFLFELSHALTVYDAVCKRVLSFISKCVNSDCDLVSFSARRAVLYGCMSFPLGRSALGCSLRCSTLNASYIPSLITAMWYGIFICQLDRRNC